MNILVFLSGSYKICNAKEEVSSENKTVKPSITITDKAKEKLQKINKDKEPEDQVMNIIYLREE